MKQVLIFILLVFGVIGVNAATDDSRGPSIRKFIENKTAKDSSTLRGLRRVGVGAAFSGATGMYGAYMDLNLSPRSGFLLGYGGGTGFQAITTQYRYYFEGQSLSPYLGIGYAQWNGRSQSGESIRQTTPSYLADSFLRPEQRASGRFNLGLIVPALGIQYVQVDGSWAGTAFYAELVMLMNSYDFNSVPTGSIGTAYYF